MEECNTLCLFHWKCILLVASWQHSDLPLSLFLLRTLGVSSPRVWGVCGGRWAGARQRVCRPWALTAHVQIQLLPLEAGDPGQVTWPLSALASWLYCGGKVNHSKKQDVPQSTWQSAWYTAGAQKRLILFIFLKLKNSWFTMLCEILLDSTVIQLHPAPRQSLREGVRTSHCTTSIWLNRQPKLLLTKDKSGKMIYSTLIKNSLKSKENKDFLGVQWLGLPTTSAGGLCSFPGQRIRSHVSQLRPGTDIYVNKLKRTHPWGVEKREPSYTVGGNAN